MFEKRKRFERLIKELAKSTENYDRLTKELETQNKDLKASWRKVLKENKRFVDMINRNKNEFSEYIHANNLEIIERNVFISKLQNRIFDLEQQLKKEVK